MEPEGQFHNRQPAVPILSQLSPVHASSSHFLKIHLTLFSLLRLDLLSGLFPSGLPHQNHICTSPVPHSCHMPHRCHCSRLDHTNNIGWKLQVIKRLVFQSSSLSCYLVPLRPKYSPQHRNLDHPQPMSPLQYGRPNFTPIQTTRKITILYRVIQNDCRGFNNLSYTIHLR